MNTRWCWVLGSIATIWSVSLPAQNGPLLYTLIDGSQLIDDCPICDRPTIAVPMRGTFELRLDQVGPLSSLYAIENIHFKAGTPNGPSYTVQGKGTYRITGEVAVTETITLEVQIDNGFTNFLCFFTNAPGSIARFWPMVRSDVDQTNGTFTQQFHLDLFAAPFREIWFSIGTNFKTASETISGGDLLSSVGRTVRKNSQLTGHLGIQPVVPDLGLKDVDILDGGEVAFSINQDVFSETLGPLSAGDILSDQGRIIRSNQDLLIGFDPDPAGPPGFGLGALKLSDSGEIYFSVQTNFLSKTLAKTIHRGDLLSFAQTNVFRAGKDLLSAFKPVDADQDYGLDAVFVWPTGEIWFSTSESFVGANSISYSPGDLLSDRGYVVYRNAELLAGFGSATDPPDPGLDSLYVISDLTLPSPGAGHAQLDSPALTNQPPQSLRLSWKGAGKYYQLEVSGEDLQSFNPASPVTLDLSYTLPGALTNGVLQFYRLREW